MLKNLTLNKKIIYIGMFIIFIPYFPVLIYVLPLSIIGNCNVDVGNVRPCVLLGIDFGQSLYTLGVAGWLGFFFSLPIGLLISFVGIIKSAIERSRKT